MPDPAITAEDRLDAEAYRRLRDYIVARTPEKWGDDVAEDAIVAAWAGRWGGVYTEIALARDELEEPVSETAYDAAAAQVFEAWPRHADLRAALVRLAAVAVAAIEEIDQRPSGDAA